jgi:hypothetical protein
VIGSILEQCKIIRPYLITFGVTLVVLKSVPKAILNASFYLAFMLSRKKVRAHWENGTF